MTQPNKSGNANEAENVQSPLQVSQNNHNLCPNQPLATSEKDLNKNNNNSCLLDIDAIIPSMNEKIKEEDNAIEEQESSEIGDGKKDKDSVRGRWTKKEHEKFIFALHEFGNKWDEVAEYVESRTITQVRSHAQKFFDKLKLHEMRKMRSASPNSAKIFVVTRMYLNRIAPPKKILVLNSDRPKSPEHQITPVISSPPAPSQDNPCLFPELKSTYQSPPMSSSYNQAYQPTAPYSYFPPQVQQNTGYYMWLPQPMQTAMYTPNPFQRQCIPMYYR